MISLMVQDGKYLGERDCFHRAANLAAKVLRYNCTIEQTEEWLYTLAVSCFCASYAWSLARVSVLRAFRSSTLTQTDNIGCTSLQALFVILFAEQTSTGSTVIHLSTRGCSVM